LIKECRRVAFHGWSCRYFCNQHRDLHTPLVVNTRMQAGEVRNDGGLPTAELANDGTTVRFGGGFVAIKARLDSRNGGFE